MPAHSIYTALRAHVDGRLPGPIDHEAVRLATNTWDEAHVPGLEDALHDFGTAGDDYLLVANAVADVASGALSDWRNLEAIVGGIDIKTSLNAALRSIRRDDVTRDVATMFWQLARGSSLPNAVKWGMAIGSIGLADEDLPDLLLLARHSEFTAYACSALLRESEHRRGYRFELVELLGMTTGVGRLQVINAILGDDVLAGSARAQRAVLCHVVDEGNDISPALARAVASRIDIGPWLPVTADDPEVARGLDRIVEQILILHDELDTLIGEEGMVTFFERLCDVVECRPPSIQSLSVLRLLKLVMNLNARDWQIPDALRDRADLLYRTRLDSDQIRSGLDDEHYRWHSLAIIAEESMEEMLPDVHRDFVRRPNVIAIDILGRLGGNAELETLRQWLQRGFPVRARQALLAGGTAVAGGAEHTGMIAAFALQHMGRLGTREAIDLVVAGLRDFELPVRGAALRAISDLEPWQIEPPMVDALRLVARDPSPRLRDAAAVLIQQFGISGIGARHRGQWPSPN